MNRSARRAILCVCLASFLFTLSAALVKALSPSMPTAEIVLFRAGIAVFVTLPAMRGGWRALRTRYPFGHALRTAFGLGSMFGSYYAYAHLPLVTVTATGFAMPLLLTVLSVLLLRERLTGVRLGAVVFGFVGVLIMVRPWEVEQGELPLGPVLAALGNVLAWALAMLTIRRMGAMGESNGAIVMWYTLGATVVAALLTIPVWVTPDHLTLLALIGVGLLSGLAQLSMTEGYRAGESTLVAPFEYGAAVYSTILGVVFWGEWPDLWSVLGVVILVSAGTAVWRRG